VKPLTWRCSTPPRASAQTTVAPQLRSFEVFELGADRRYAHALSATEGVLATVPGTEGLSLDLDALWSDLDRLEIDDAGTAEEDPEG